MLESASPTRVFLRCNSTGQKTYPAITLTTEMAFLTSVLRDENDVSTGTKQNAVAAVVMDSDRCSAGRYFVVTSPDNVQSYSFFEA